MGLRTVLPSFPTARRRSAPLAPFLQSSPPPSRHRRPHSYLSPSEGQPVATRHLARNRKASIRRLCFNSRAGCLSGDNAFRSDWLPEKGGLEPPVSREAFQKESGRKGWLSFASNSVGSLERMSSLAVRYYFQRL